MENNKMKNLTNDLKAFEQMMKKQRKENRYPEVEVEIDTDADTEEDSPTDILLQVSDMLLECSVMVAKAAFLVGLMEEETEEGEEDECDNCPFNGDCGSTYGTMFLVACPNGDNTIMTMDELSEEIGDIFVGKNGTYVIHPIPETEALYYTIAEKRPLKRGSRVFYKEPAVIFGIDEEAGEIVSPNVRQLYAAARYFEEHSTTIRTREGEVSVFCFD